MPYLPELPADVPELSLVEMLEIVKKAEEDRHKQCVLSARSYLRKVARQRGMTPEEYIATKDPRGFKLKYFPDGKNVLPTVVSN